MGADKLLDRETADEQEPLISPIDRNRHRKFGSYSYKPEYCEIIFKLLSTGTQAKTKSHCCNALLCSKPTLINWMKTYPEFNDAITSGLEIGEVKWRDKIRKHAFSPSSEVNNGLIKLLSANVYGIKEEPTTVVNITNQNINNPEEEMKKRGIPIPKNNIKDIEDV